MESIRAFFALVPDAAAREFLQGQLRELKEAIPEVPVRWVRAENLHLTLRFLGEVEAGSRVEELVREAETVVKGSGAFSWRIGAPEFFPNQRRPIVIAAGIEPSERLAELAARLERVAVRCGFAAETRKFRPHLTLGRIKRGTRIRLPAFEASGCESVADQVILMRSGWPDSPGDYRVIQAFPLERR